MNFCKTVSNTYTEIMVNKLSLKAIFLSLLEEATFYSGNLPLSHISLFSEHTVYIENFSVVQIKKTIGIKTIFLKPRIYFKKGNQSYIQMQYLIESIKFINL